MWNTNKSEAPSQPQAPSATSHTPETRAVGAGAPPPPAAPAPSASTFRPSAPVARDLATLGASLTIKGQIIGEEDLQIDGKIEGPITLNGHRLTVGRSANLNSEINAREVIVYGKALGNLRAKDRVEIKKDGEVMGDITTSRISIEDGAYFKGRIEIERKHKNDGKSEPEMSHENTQVGVAN
jgi:cytoskeletal protein CcmA (bactofilin family)